MVQHLLFIIIIPDSKERNKVEKIDEKCSKITALNESAGPHFPALLVVYVSSLERLQTVLIVDSAVWNLLHVHVLTLATT